MFLYYILWFICLEAEMREIPRQLSIEQMFAVEIKREALRRQLVTLSRLIRT